MTTDVRDRLEDLAAEVTASDLSVHAATAERLAPYREQAGRLTDVAVWWAATRGEEHPAPPRSAALLTLGVPEGGAVLAPPAAARVTRLPSLVPEEVADAVEWGVATADRVADEGHDVVLLGVRDHTRARVLAAGLMGQDPVEAVGWPSQDLDDDRWTDLVVGLRDGLRAVRGLRGEPTTMLTRLDSPVLAAGTAVLVQAAARRTPVVLDGYSSFVCAVLARRLSRATAYWTLVAQGDQGRHVLRALKSLSQTPVVDLGIRSEDGASALLGLALVETACGLLTA